MAEQQVRRASGAKMAEVVEFFTSASDQARQVVDYFRQADPAEAAAALAVATAVVKGRTPNTGAPRGRRRKAQDSDNAGGSAPQAAASNTVAVPASAGPARVVSANTSQGGTRTGRVVGGGSDDKPESK